jgi:hypothetical protein
VLLEIEAEHWVACWRTEAVAEQGQRSPMLAFRASPDDRRQVAAVAEGAEAAAAKPAQS